MPARQPRPQQWLCCTRQTSTPRSRAASKLHNMLYMYLFLFMRCLCGAGNGVCCIVMAAIGSVREVSYMAINSDNELSPCGDKRRASASTRTRNKLCMKNATIATFVFLFQSNMLLSKTEDVILHDHGCHRPSVNDSW